MRDDQRDFADLKVGTRVRVEGTCTEPSTLQAFAISLEREGPDRLEGPVDAVDTEAGVITMLGVGVSTGPRTRIVDAGNQPMHLGKLKPGMRIKTKGRFSDGRLEADKIKHKPTALDEFDEIEGAITLVDASQRAIQVLGFRVLCGPDIDIEG